MKPAPRTGFVGKARQVAVSAADRWRPWVLFIAMAKDRARRTISGQAISGDEATAFAGVVMRLNPRAFPLEWASAQAAAGAAVSVARGYVAAARPEDKEALADFMLSGACCLDTLHAGHVVAEAAHWRRQIGEVD